MLTVAGPYRIYTCFPLSRFLHRNIKLFYYQWIYYHYTISLSIFDSFAKIVFMIVIRNKADITIEYQVEKIANKDKVIFFDIETTGFS